MPDYVTYQKGTQGHISPPYIKKSILYDTSNNRSWYFLFPFLNSCFAESTDYNLVDEQAIFANNELGLRHIDVYGFDYDYTLASYSDALHYLIYNFAVKNLISTYGVRNIRTSQYLFYSLNMFGWLTDSVLSI